MPFLSPAQEKFMFANHPEIAKRWYANYGNAPTKMAHANDKSSTHVTAGPKRDGLPRPGGTRRDFGMLKPSASSRFAPKAASTPNEMEAHKEGPVEAMPGANPGLMSMSSKLSGNRARDVATASNYRRTAARRSLHG